MRQRVFAHFFATSDAADAFTAGFRIPNLLQNLFGEGALSASFIPVYAGLRAHDQEGQATRLAGAVAALLGAAIAIFVLAGVLAAPWLVDLIAPGFTGEKRELTVRLVQILFPGAGLLVLSAWCLGVLNSHGRFFLSYAAPVTWNAALVAALVIFGPRSTLPQLAVYTAWASVAGSLFQVLVQLPQVLAILGGLQLSWSGARDSRRTVVRNFIPAFISRGVVQISAYVDAVLSSLLPTGAVAALSYAQTLYTLPVSLFGMAVSAAELPAMSGARGNAEEVGAYLRDRLNRGLRQIALFVIPSAAGFAILGDVMAQALFQSGRFTRGDALWVWGILAGSAVGLLASTMGRLYASTFYALQDTRTPLRFAVLRVTLTVGLGYLFAIPLPGLLGIPALWGVAGLTLSAGLAGWVEFVLLRRALRPRIGATGLNPLMAFKLWVSAGLAGGLARAADLLVSGLHPIPRAVLVLGLFGTVYFSLASLLRVPEARSVLRYVLPAGPGRP